MDVLRNQFELSHLKLHFIIIDNPFLLYNKDYQGFCTDYLQKVLCSIKKTPFVLKSQEPIVGW